MRFTTHNTAAIDINGTSLQGYLQATRKQLEKAFGPPQESDEYKVPFNWLLKFEDGTVANIYCWKYNPDSDRPYDYHVGGTSRKTVQMVHGAFRDALGLMQASA